MTQPAEFGEELYRFLQEKQTYSWIQAIRMERFDHASFTLFIEAGKEQTIAQRKTVCLRLKPILSTQGFVLIHLTDCNESLLDIT
jgi:hypothetical protein